MHLTKIEIRGDEFPTHRAYPFNTPTLRSTGAITFSQPISFFVGENGSGKSTLLEGIARRCGIHIWDKPKRHMAHDNPYETLLKDYLSPTWSNGFARGSFFRAETFHDLADFLDDVALCDPGRLQYHGGRILNTLSHGEGMLAYFSGRLRVKGLYFLDEPEAALSPTNQVRFVNLLRRFAAGGLAQFIIATHSPILLACPGAQILSFDSPCIQDVSYEDTSHFQLYRDFITDRDSFMKFEEQGGCQLER